MVMATANMDANVREGDGRQYSVIRTLLEGEGAQIFGISSLGTRWYLIELPNGRRGWVSPDLVTVSGDTDDLPSVNPSPPSLLC
jgi:uncharacterized protein YgiM (DUF1202 family)